MPDCKRAAAAVIVAMVMSSAGGCIDASRSIPLERTPASTAIVESPESSLTVTTPPIPTSLPMVGAGATSLPTETMIPVRTLEPDITAMPFRDMLMLPDGWKIVYEVNHPIELQTTEGVLYAGFTQVAEESEMQFVDGASVLIAGFDTEDHAGSAFEKWEQNFHLSRYGEDIATMDTIYEGGIHLISHKITEMYGDPQLSGYVETYFIMHGCTIVVEYHFLEHSGRYPQATPETLSNTERMAAALGTIRKTIDHAECGG